MTPENNAVTFEDEFEELNPSQGMPSKRRQVTKLGVIKKSRHKEQGVFVMEPNLEDHDDGVEFFQPVYEGEVVVGMIHKCSCGKTSEVRFEYDNPDPPLVSE